MDSPSKKLLTTSQAAEIIGCSVQHVRHLIRVNKLTAHKENDEWKVVSASAKLYQKLVPRKGWIRGQKRKMA